MDTSQQALPISDHLAEMAATSELLSQGGGLSEILRTLADRSRNSPNADYAAISVFDSNGELERFVYTGISDELARRLGHPPRGRGLLGELSRHDVPLRVDDLRQHHSFTGWPEGHPEMRAFIGAPLRAGGKTIGSLYMTRNEGREAFSEVDELSAAILSLQAAASVANAIVGEREGRLSLFEERERIAHDLHDGTIQSLYALGLECDALFAARGDLSHDVREELDSAVGRINDIIGDIRGYITLLEAKNPEHNPDLSRDLPFVARQLVPEGVDTVVNITASALQEISGRAAEDLLYIVREALSNAVRHGNPNKIAIDLRQGADETTLTVQDNGVGFDPATARSGLGTVTMRTRAARLGGDLLLLGVPGMGTTVRVTLPRELE
ncbi:MAG: GAF domain-containing protein [Dehalococcoidia bacterium]|nr:GAF domain-containing protein [Dehalococcoidia bacterium]